MNDFEKIFMKITSNGNFIYELPYDFIIKQFPDSLFHKLNIDSNDKLKIINDNIKSVINDNYNIIIASDIKDLTKVDDKILDLAVVNNKLNIVKQIIENTNIKLTNKHLAISAEFGYEDLYNYLLTNNCRNSISIFRKAVNGLNLNIVKRCHEDVSIDLETIELALDNNHTEIALYLLENLEDKLILNINLINYAIKNANHILVNYLDKILKPVYHPKLFNAALLSGDMSMIKFIESKISDIHLNYKLDQIDSKTQSEWNSEKIFSEISYGNNLISNTIIYAIQSNNLEILQYIHGLGYEISLSAVIRSIQSGNIDIIKYILDNYSKPIPHYIISYTGFYAGHQNKNEILKLIIPYITIINDEELELFHNESILDRFTDNIYDEDYLFDNYNKIQIIPVNTLFELDYVRYYVLFNDTNCKYKYIIDNNKDLYNTFKKIYNK